MAFDPVPWFVGGEALHSPEVARLLAYASTSGAEGIVSVGDLKVQPLAVPGTAVRVMPGAALILNRATGGSQQTYVARNVSATEVDIAPTSSSGGRSDLIVAQIEDPHMPGEPWQDPADPTVGPYVHARVISNVPRTTTRLQDIAAYSGRSAVTLARIDIPASTGTITSSMITDLRNVALPRRETRQIIYDPPNERFLLNGSTDWQPWPVLSGGTGTYGHVDVPAWATHVQITSLYTSVGARGNTYGRARTLLGYGEDLTAEAAYDTTVLPTSDPYQIALHCAAELAVPSSIRGTRQPVRTEGRLGATNIPRERGPWSTGATRVVTQLVFEERAV